MHKFIRYSVVGNRPHWFFALRRESGLNLFPPTHMLLPCGENLLHAVKPDGAVNFILVQERLHRIGSCTYFDLRHTVCSFRKQSYGHVEKCKGELFKNSWWHFFEKFPSDAFSFINCSYRFAFGIKLTYTPWHYFSLSHTLACKKNGMLKSAFQWFTNF